MRRDFPKTVPLGRVIASRKFALKGNPKAKAELRIGASVDWDRNAYCPVQLVGIGDERVKPIWGVDRVQALQMVFRYVEPLLIQYGDRLRWENVRAHQSLVTDPWPLFEGAGLSDFLSKFAALCAEQAAQLAPRTRQHARS